MPIPGKRVTEPMAAVIKLARERGYNYETIGSYLKINQGRIADVMKGRIAPDVSAAPSLPPDFPLPGLGEAEMTTSKKDASLASKILRSSKSSKASKSVAASDLSQRRGAKKGK